ncbi:hypothetical protein [Comamonas sp. MYb396]|uniref:hypothetical protein n=1 Tax=Comamonas sp. MYb396 TaxID=2745302 RepID=UPI0030D7B0EF
MENKILSPLFLFQRPLWPKATAGPPKIGAGAASNPQSRDAGKAQSSTKNVDNFVGNVSSAGKIAQFTGFFLDCLKNKLIKISKNQKLVRRFNILCYRV